MSARDHVSESSLSRREGRVREGLGLEAPLAPHLLAGQEVCFQLCLGLLGEFVVRAEVESRRVKGRHVSSSCRIRASLLDKHAACVVIELETRHIEGLDDPGYSFDRHVISRTEVRSLKGAVRYAGGRDLWSSTGVGSARWWMFPHPPIAACQ